MSSHKPKWQYRTRTGIHDPTKQVSVTSECRRVVASYKDSITSRDISPKGTDTAAKKDTCRSTNVSGAVANYQGSVETQRGISLYRELLRAYN